MSPEEAPPVHAMTPQELAEQGIPVEVALRARIEEAQRARTEYRSWVHAQFFGGKVEAYRDALAIIEAQR